jgi:cyclopropane fatty-acyl-phospholipid synthase-like methyltransferase
MAYTFDNKLRRLFHNPELMLDLWVGQGMTVLDIGCGMGYFSIAMAGMVGEKGAVVSVDLQEKMLAMVLRRAERAGVRERIHPHLSGSDRLNLPRKAGFALAFWMVHEVPDLAAFFADVYSALEPGGSFFIAEPGLHVGEDTFEKELSAALAAGFCERCRPRVRFSRAAVLERH